MGFNSGFKGLTSFVKRSKKAHQKLLIISHLLWKKVKCTLVQALRLCTGRTAHRGSRGIALPFHDHGTRRRWVLSVTPRPLFTPRERPGTHCTGGWVGPRAGLDRCGKSRPPSSFDSRTVQPIASRYTYWATRPTNTIVCCIILINCIMCIFHYDSRLSRT